MASQQKTIEQLFGAALDQPPEQRAAYLHEACRGAPDVRQQVEELLLADQRLGSFLEQPLLGPEVHVSTKEIRSAGESRSEPLLYQLSSPGVNALKPGQLLIGRFLVIRFIARGGMGEIYEVEDLFLQKVRVALKVILPKTAASAGSSHQFEQEVLLARKVIHANLCPIYDIARSAESVSPFLFLTMKLLSGETLAAHLQSDKLFTEEETCSILRQMCAGLGALHDAGVIHRDIKPTNVMLERCNTGLRLYIMDFGLARIHDSLTTGDGSSLIAGTPGYLAPELLEGARPSKASDIYALGVLLRLLLTHQQTDDLDEIGETRSLAISHQKRWSLLRYAATEFRAKDFNVRCSAFLRVQEALASNKLEPYQKPLALQPSLGVRGISRRQFVVSGIASVGAVAATAFWNRERLRDFLHPLPTKRFVALLTWPISPDVRVQHLLTEVIDVIGRELLRAEAYDRDLLIIPDTAAKRITNVSELREIHTSFGANLLLTVAGEVHADKLHLSLKILDASLNRPIRERLLHSNLKEQTSLPPRAVTAAADLLGISRYTRNEDRIYVGTDNAGAYAAFQAAEALRRRDTVASLGEAIMRYQDALKLDPRYAVAMAKLSWAYLRMYALQGDPAALSLAKDTCAAAISRDPTLIDAHLVLAWVYEQTGDKQEASQELATALSIDPADPDTLRFQARSLAENGRFSEAEERLRQLIRGRPNLWLGHNELGSFFYDRGRYADALNEYHAAQISAPRNIVPLYNIGSVLLQQGKLRQAKEVLEQSFALEPNDIAALNLAAVARERGLFQEAIHFAREAISLNPEEPANLLELGDASQAAGFHIASASAYEQAADKQEGQLRTQRANGAGWMLLALCRAKLGVRAAAWTAMEKADALDANDMESQLVKIRILELLGRRDDAIKLLQECLKQGATTFQLQTMPDLDALRLTPQFRDVMSSEIHKTQ